MSTPPAPTRAAAVSSPTPAANGGRQIPKPIKRHLPFSSMKPPFVSPEDYHRFNIPSVTAADFRNQEAEAIVVKSPVSLVLSLFNQFNCSVFLFV